MASEAQRKGKILAEEQAKPYPDQDIVYALKQTQPYWNTIDTNRIGIGINKLKGRI